MKMYLMLLVMILVLFIVGGCFNIFSPLFVDPRSNDLSQLYDEKFLVEMGDYYADIGDYITAESFYARALEINSSNSRALIGVANCALFSVVPRTNILGFYSNIISNFNNLSNYYEFIDMYVTNQNYYKVSEEISKYVYLVISGASDNKYLTNDYNLHFSFSVFNKIYTFFLTFDSNFDGKVSTNDLVYNFIKSITNLSDTNLNLPNDFLLEGKIIKKSMDIYFKKSKESLDSLRFISNGLNSSSNSIDVQIYNIFEEVDRQITNVYTNFIKYYNFYSDMYNRIVYLLTNNGISFDIATNISRLTNSLSITNYYIFDNKDITNILNTNDVDSWNILTNYIDLNRLTNG
ncbi:MAG: hypothetical protein ACP5KI_00460 [Brevinematia bacterium]